MHADLRVTAATLFRRSPFRRRRCPNRSAICGPAELHEQRLVLAVPTLDVISDIVVSQDASEQSVSLTGITDGDNASQPIRITGTSSDLTVVPHPAVSYDSPGSSGTLFFAPAPGASGSVSVTVNVEDGGQDNNLQTPADNEYTTRVFRINVHARVTGIGVAGDSLSDEYLHESYNYANNWMQLLAAERNLNFGAQNDTVSGNADDRGEPRREGGFEFNWARSGANSATLLNQQQHTSLANQIAAGDVSHVVLAVGQNDFQPGIGSPYWQIYFGFWSQGRIEQHISSVLENITTAVETLQRGNVRLVLSNIVDYGIAPATQEFFTSASRRQLVSEVIDTLNDRILAAADDWLTPVVDMNALTKKLLSGNSIMLGGNTFSRSAGVAVSNLFVADGAHPHTVSSSVLANGFLAGFHYGYADWIAPLSEQEVVESIGLSFVQNSFNLDYQPYVQVPVNDAPTLDAIGDVTVLEDAGEQILELTGISAGGNEIQPLRLSVSSDNPGLISDPLLEYTSAESTGRLRFTPQSARNGTATITVTVQDGGVDRDFLTLADNASWTRSFIVHVTPTRPTITAPGATTVLQRPRLEWTAVPDAVWYQIWIGNSTTGVNPYLQGESTTTVFDVPQDLGIGRMDLWVRGVRGDGTFLPWTKMHRFRVVTPPVVNQMPVRQETPRPQFTWPKVSGAVAYDVWVNNISTGENAIVRARVTQPEWTPETDLPMSRYRFWVRGEAADGGLGNWSVRTSVYTVPAPQLITPIQPTFDRMPQFDWSDVSGASSYGLFVRSLVNGAVVVDIAGLPESQWTLSGPGAELSDGRYAWWAIAESNVAGFRSAWSQRQEFYIGGQTSITGPQTPLSTATPLIEWLPVSGVARYVLQVNGEVEGSRLIYLDDLTSTSFQVTVPLVNGRNYRAWVQAISVVGEAAPWSKPYDFTVAAINRLPGVDESLYELAAGQMPEALPSDRAEPGCRVMMLPQQVSSVDGPFEAVVDIAGWCYRETATFLVEFPAPLSVLDDMATDCWFAENAAALEL